MFLYGYWLSSSIDTTNSTCKDLRARIETVAKDVRAGSGIQGIDFEWEKGLEAAQRLLDECDALQGNNNINTDVSQVQTSNVTARSIGIPQVM